ncbi:transmembrane amino acid transporter protein domain-containing protein [Phthorimaea operculella]|nr:transmembrane amino acid transporter protein domain-containing protein [Phthorimaea operculella]
MDDKDKHEDKTLKFDSKDKLEQSKENRASQTSSKVLDSPKSTTTVSSKEESQISHYIEDDAYPVKHSFSNYLNQLDFDSIEDLSHYPGAETSEFDFVSERHNVYTTNLLEAAGHMIKGMLGVGILSMHEAYMRGGIWTSLATTFVLGFISPYNTLMLVKIAQKTYRRMRIAKMTYPDLMEAAVATGPRCLRRYRKCLRYTLDVFLIIELFSTCSVYQIMTAITLQKIIEATTKSRLHLRIYILIVTLPLILMCAIKRLKYLARLSIVGDIFIVVCVLIALGYSIRGMPPLSERVAWRSMYGFFGFTGIFIFSIDSITLAMPIENNMSKPQLFPVIACLSVPLVIIFGTLVGFVGYWKWGEKCVTPIILHLPHKPESLTLYALFALVLCLTFTVQFWIPFKIIWRYQKMRIKSKHRFWFWETTGRCVLVIVITIISVSFPSFITFIEFIGNVFLGFITFIFPPLIDVFMTFRDRLNVFKRIVNVVSVISGFIFVVGGFYSLGVGKK